MKIIKNGEAEIIISNPGSKHNYFGWPTVAKLQNGRIAVTASGFRTAHVCPFGKAVIAYSDDEGKSYSLPATVIDTVLDDRDSGVVPFGKSNVIVTSFNNSVKFQREFRTVTEYGLAYLDTVSEEEESEALGSTFRISNDFGVTFGKIFKSPVTSPHGPAELSDGTLLWVGRTFNPMDAQRMEKDCIQAYKIMPEDGSTEFVGEIENIEIDGELQLSCEPHAIVSEDGSVITHIRVQGEKTFTIFQSKSEDCGKTWTKPEQILPDYGGAPTHLFKHSSGLLISTYGFRGNPYNTKPFGIKVMFSRDNGKTWDTDYNIYENNISVDLGYPSTIELSDGSLLTVFYARPKEGEAAVIMQQRWRFEE